MGIKILLLAGVASLFYFVLRRSSLLGQRLLGIALFFVAIITVLFPQISTVIANWLGVGRGTDLVLYVAILLSGFVLQIAFLRISQLEVQVTRLVRSIAQLTATPPRGASAGPRRLGGGEAGFSSNENDPNASSSTQQT